MIDKLDVKEMFNIGLVCDKINEIINKLNSIEESVSSHFGEQFDTRNNLLDKLAWINKQPKEENKKSLLEQARGYKIPIQVRHSDFVEYNIKNDVDKKIDLYEQYAKEAEEIKETFQDWQITIAKETEDRIKVINGLKQEIEQLKQNKIEIGHKTIKWFDDNFVGKDEIHLFVDDEDRIRINTILDQLKKAGVDK